MGGVEQEYSTGVGDINVRTLDNSGRTENESQKEKNGMISGKRRTSRFITGS